MQNDMLRWSFTLKVGVLEPYTDLTAQLQGAEEFPSLRDEVSGGSRGGHPAPGRDDEGASAGAGAGCGAG